MNDLQTDQEKILVAEPNKKSMLFREELCHCGQLRGVYHNDRVRTREHKVNIVHCEIMLCHGYSACCVYRSITLWCTGMDTFPVLHYTGKLPHWESKIQIDCIKLCPYSP